MQAKRKYPHPTAPEGSVDALVSLALVRAYQNMHACMHAFIQPNHAALQFLHSHQPLLCLPLLQQADITESHVASSAVQDPYSSPEVGTFNQCTQYTARN